MPRATTLRLGLRLVGCVSLASALASAPRALVPSLAAPSRAGGLPGAAQLGAGRLGGAAALRCAAPTRGRSPASMLACSVKTEPGCPEEAAPRGGEWRRLSSAPAELRCGVTLVCGQSFRWRATGDSEWTGVIADRMVTVSEDAQGVHITACEQVAPVAAGGSARPRAEGAVAMQRVQPDDALMAAATEYFGLSTPLAPLYRLWSAADPVWAQLATRFPGLRVLRQDPVECLFCFICSSNNNIARIALMVDRLSERYGTFLGAQGGYNFYSFPSIEALAAADEDDLRALGTGYRAKFILQSAATVLENGGREWLQQLRSRETSHMQARDALITLHGVGLKVADCVCLFALDKTGAIPVDTHVWQITLREMDATLSQAKSLTPTIYDQVGRLWRDRYGEHAGWAHTILFAADLAKFKKLRNEALGEDEDSTSTSPKHRKSPSKAPKDPVAAAGGAPPSAGAKKKRKSPAKEAARGSKSRQSSDEDESASVARATEGPTGRGTGLRTTTPKSKGRKEYKKEEPDAQDSAALFEALYGVDHPASPLFAPTPAARTKAQSASGDEASTRRTKSVGASARSLKPRQLIAGKGEDDQGALGEASGATPFQADGVDMDAGTKAGGRSASGASKGNSPLPKIPRKKSAPEK